MRINSLSPPLLSLFVILQSSKGSILLCCIHNFRPLHGVIIRGGTTEALHGVCRRQHVRRCGVQEGGISGEELEELRVVHHMLHGVKLLNESWYGC